MICLHTCLSTLCNSTGLSVVGNCVENVLFLHAHLDERRRSVNDQPALHLRLLWLELFDFYVQRILKFLIHLGQTRKNIRFELHYLAVNFVVYKLKQRAWYEFWGEKWPFARMPSGVMVGNYCGFLTIWCVSKDPSSPPPQHDRVVFQTLHSCLMDHIWWISVVSSEFSIAVHFQVLSISISLGWNEITWQLLSRRIWTQKRES